MQPLITHHVESVKLAWGKVRHQRTAPKPNGFETGACFVRVKFTSAPFVEKHSKGLLKIDQPGLFSIHGKNYGFEKHDKPLEQIVSDMHQKVENETGLSLSGPVELQTFPKILGFVFNPVSFWYFHDQNNNCAAILCEVNNTFGERHFYCIQKGGAAPLNKGQESIADKHFHVSPFFPVSGQYKFRFMDQANRSLARIDYYDNDQLQLSTSISGQLQKPSTGRWAQTLLKFGWATVMVVVKIHWQALKLWFKGAKFHTKPKPPTHSMTEAKTTL